MPNITILTDSTSLLTYQNSMYNKPYTYITLTVNSVVYDITSYVLQAPLIDRQKRILPESLSDLRSTDAVFTLSNETKYFSPLHPSSLFYGINFFNSKINVYSGFWTSDTDVSVISQLMVYLNEINLDTSGSTIKLICSGVTKKLERKKVGEPLSDGTANPKIYVGVQSFKTIVEDLLFTYGKLEPAEYSVQDIDYTFNAIEFTNVSILTAINYLCQAVAAEIYEGGKGNIIIEKLTVVWGESVSSITTPLTDSTNIMSMFVSFTDDDLLSKIIVDGATSIYSEQEIVDNISGRIITITNSYIQTISMANDLVARFIEKFGVYSVLLEISLDFMPVLDIGDICLVTETQSGLTSEEFEVYRVSLDLENFKGRIYLVKSYYLGNFGFAASDTVEISDANAPEADDYDSADAHDLKFCYAGDRNILDTTPPNYLAAR